MSELSQSAKILIVEDDPSIRFGLGEVFSAEGFAIATCDRGDRVGHAIGEEKPDLIILDVMLPGIDGWQLLQIIRRKSQVPVLFLTARDAVPDCV